MHTGQRLTLEHSPHHGALGQACGASHSFHLYFTIETELLIVVQGLYFLNQHTI